MNLKKYFNKIHYNKVVSILILSSLIISFNISLYAGDASRSDSFLIVKTSSLDDDCVNKCNSISENAIMYRRELIGIMVRTCIDKGGINCVDISEDNSPHEELECSDHEYSCSYSVSGDNGIAIGSGENKVVLPSNSFIAEVSHELLYRYVCYSLSGDSIQLAPSILANLGGCKKQVESVICGSLVDVLSAIGKHCKGKLEDFKSICRSRCAHKYVLKIKGKEINTVGDLLDSVPTTEFLKVYDPNMVNY